MKTVAVSLVAGKGYFSKFIIFTGATPPKNSNMGAISKLVRAPT
jgi:hypothetical protein